MARKRKSASKWVEIHPEDFDRYAVTLGDMMEDLVTKHPDLVKAEDVHSDIRYSPVEHFIDGKQTGNRVSLWHGTTEDRAAAILSEGFVVTRGWIWMTRQHSYASSHAIRRSQNRRKAAVLFRCSVNLEDYPDFSRHGPHYAFKSPRIARQVIRRIFRLEFSREVIEEAVVALVDVTINETSGIQEILRWINGCMKLIDERLVQEDHPVVEELLRWVEAQYANGRDDPITEEEMLIQLSEASINQASKHFRVGIRAIDQWIDSGRLKAKSLRGCPIAPLHLQGIPVRKSRNIVTLWHGTTEDRAKAIAEGGFRKPGVWFSRKRPVASSMAVKRARQRSDVPVVIACEIDLGKYPSFWRPNPDTYVFYIPAGMEVIDKTTVGKEVVREISVVADKYSKHSKNKASRPSDIAHWVSIQAAPYSTGVRLKYNFLDKDKADRQKSVDVVVTGTSGKLGVLCWINRYLELEGAAALKKDHPAVESVFNWVDAQYAAGRDEPISDEEMLAQVRQNLKLED